MYKTHNSSNLVGRNMYSLTKNILATIFLLLTGQVAAEINERVVNGSDATIHNYPFMVSLRVPLDYHVCGASIIAPNFVLTAAHCVDGWNPRDITIQYAQTEVSEKGPNVIPIKRIHMHESYRPDLGNDYANDIALLELAGRFVYNFKTLAPVQLPEQDFEVAADSPVVLIGWGLNATGGEYQTRLQSVDLKTYSDFECSQRHNNVTNGQYHLCAGSDAGGRGQCTGDSGGPLLLNGRIQVGIVSWSVKPCGTPTHPGVYTKVAKYINWIKRQMAGQVINLK